MFRLYFFFCGFGRMSMYLHIMDSITSSAPPPIDNKRKSLKQKQKKIWYIVYSTNMLNMRSINMWLLISLYLCNFVCENKDMYHHIPIKIINEYFKTFFYREMFIDYCLTSEHFFVCWYFSILQCPAIFQYHKDHNSGMVKVNIVNIELHLHFVISNKILKFEKLW